MVPVKLILLGHSRSQRDSSPSCGPSFRFSLSILNHACILGPRRGLCSQPVTIYSLRLEGMEAGPIWLNVHSGGRKTTYCAESTQQGPMGHL